MNHFIAICVDALWPLMQMLRISFLILQEMRMAGKLLVVACERRDGRRSPAELSKGFEPGGFTGETIAGCLFPRGCVLPRARASGCVRRARGPVGASGGGGYITTTIIRMAAMKGFCWPLVRGGCGIFRSYLFLEEDLST